MEGVENENSVTDQVYLFRKMADTVKAYRTRYPELGYINSGLELIKKDESKEGSLDLLEKLDRYMHEKLFEYYVIKIIYPKFHADIESIKAGLAVDRSKELYLELTAYKENTPIK